MPKESTYSKYIWDYFMRKIANEFGVAGLMGNLYGESALRPNNLQQTYENSLGYSDESYTAAVDSGAYSKDSFVYDSAGYGLAQWTFWSRKKRMYEKWKSGGYESIGSIELACDYLWQELSQSYTGVLKVLKNASSVREASDKVLHDFERPADQSTTAEERRAGYGMDYYNLYSGSEVGGGTTEPDNPQYPYPTPDPDEPEEEPVPVIGHKMSLILLLLATRR